MSEIPTLRARAAHESRRAEREWLDALERAAAAIDAEGDNVGAEHDPRGICHAIGISALLLGGLLAAGAWLFGWPS